MEIEMQKGKQEEKKHPTWCYLVALWGVILVWGITPVISSYLYMKASPTVITSAVGAVSAFALLIINRKRLGKINRTYLKIAIPTGLVNSSASILQKIGLMYSTPARYAFLENLSCVVVPIVMLILTKKRPTPLKCVAALVCLFGCFLLAGGDMGGDIGIGELLCSLAGILYGVNIALTSVMATKLYAPLYVLLHMTVHFLLSMVTSLVLNFVRVGGEPIEAIRFAWEPSVILLIIILALVANTLCWTVRTNVMKHLDATAVAVMMPFSAVVTAIISIILGYDTLTPSLAVGAIAVLIASVLSEIKVGRQRKVALPLSDNQTEQNKNT